ncbi:OSCP, subunit 5 of the stator stalk of mitochondrial F1F0 ATP synthase [Peniophora sp. CONT]|nr:OSCP, subunit 5 of the stator stalk of mitochondrial F1F0 ATP synthase [Peniophora sp. CONT]
MLAARASSSARAAATAGLGRRAASGIAGKYAHAAYNAALAKSPQTLTKVQAELAAISSSLSSTPELASFVSNPTLSLAERTANLPKLFATAEKKEPLSDVTKNIFYVLSENGRLGESNHVIEGFNELVAQYKGELNVTVTSASPLPKDVLTKLEATLKQSQTAQKAKSLKITNKVNPSVLGGLVVDFGEKSIDMSVSSRISKLNNLLSQSV